jgi:hypothetical protein
MSEAPYFGRLDRFWPGIDPYRAGSYNLSVPAALSFCCRFAGTGVGWIEDIRWSCSCKSASILDIKAHAGNG